jgi:hypothetical protein
MRSGEKVEGEVEELAAGEEEGEKGNRKVAGEGFRPGGS